jgi:hypothetical protein
MDAGLSPARQARAQHRHELRTLTYVTIDQANGGIVRNLTQSGIGVQVVAAVRPQQQLRVRFELRCPRLQVETRAEVVWATFSGQCGIRFLEMPPPLKQQINQWIFGNLLEGTSFHAEHPESIFAAKQSASQAAETGNGNGTPSNGAEEDDGLMVSAMPVKTIPLPMRREPPEPTTVPDDDVAVTPPASTGLDWILPPVSGRVLAWAVDVMVVIASLLIFTLVFLSVTGETPRWPVATVMAAAVMMAGMYWGFVRLVGGGSLGAKLARIAAQDSESDRDEARFR